MKRLQLILLGLLIIGIELTSCSDDAIVETDLTAPKVFIQSPILLLSYSTDIGNNNVPYKVNLRAQGADEKKLEKMELQVTDSDGTIVLEKTQHALSDSEQIITISEGFETTTIGTYTAVFTAIDTNGNFSSDEVVFQYKN